jgi:metal-responsive CopG/Arc/MetJ family transcriptional regulator
MAATSVQISIDRELLARIDRDPQTRKQGRSAFIRDAVELYLAVKRHQGIDRQIAIAYRDRSRGSVADVEHWLEEQAWSQK